MNCAGGTIAVFAVRLVRPSAASTRSRANRGCPGSFVKGVHAVETSDSGWGACARTMAETDARHENCRSGLATDRRHEPAVDHDMFVIDASPS